MKKMKSFILFLGGLLLLAGCSFPGLASNQSEDTVAITGGITTESQILASMVAGMVEHYTDKQTSIINNLGTTNINHEAMMNGDADISAARYTGTDVASTLLLPPEKDPDKALDLVQKEFKERYNQDWLASYGFDNTYVFLVRRDTAEEYGLEKVSDLEDVADELTVGADRAWMTREGDGYPGFTQEYGFEFDQIYPMQIGLVYDALAAHRMDVVLGYSTDGRVASYDLVMLEDDRQYFPPYDASSIINDELAQSDPEVKDAIDRLTGKIDTETMQKLNYQSDNNLVEPSIVAERFLEQHNYFEDEE
ncbi:osmoprotectant ABC transporter substrate-binding protein [Tetragenococcus halophilus subsp. halophilus]|uniref:osmoprotectant ABC transporter substrate-binding protein n=1 Tax=Tetragenococcus halophilus TaxID=51669 RepID=UPI000CC73B34|nr:osmoprotectant ABC transporter substrate-binding protein [Tetragenococcus halophilus]MCO8283532.1 osmoprotectant ABC transporter substrate-binding protein [Tetragenococcus halophilus]MCO8291303.1 osmoprotectant ABC transporter substrate-binding protein [Tetragenococcus halophilus]MCO8295748.1 osmoprotectant ABC transporter substrate-binding protein [Tetragenococcus halophilus]GBD65828.1 osmoprotectant ABC transporter substrate-binding protein [Tetragenococcus halophilus subsp. halophilus]GB